MSTINFVNGQTPSDAFRYSQHAIGGTGTARSVAMGGAFGALGGDFSTLSQNPAGLAIYRRSEFTFTPEIYAKNVTTRYFTEENSDSKLNFNFSNLGYVGVYESDNSAIKSVNFGVGFNRLANFHSNSEIHGVNDKTTYADAMAAQANSEGGFNSSYSFFTSGLFFDSQLIQRNDSTGSYVINSSEYLNNDANLRPTEQTISSSERGKINEWVISLGVNVNDVLYFGGTLGIHSVYFKQQKSFKEIDNTEPTYEYFTFSENLITRGSGYTAKFGAIFRPIQQLRFGASIHLPVFYILNDSYETNLTSKGKMYLPKDNDGHKLDALSTDYTVTTPFKAIGSVGVILGKFLILSGDLEYLDYSKMKLRSADGGAFSVENDFIKKSYDDSYNLKLGAELRLSTVYLRGGFGYYTSPFAIDNDSEPYGLSYSGGIGVRNEDTFFDIAFQYANFDESGSLYDVNINGVPQSALLNTDTKTTRIMATIGFKF